MELLYEKKLPNNIVQFVTGVMKNRYGLIKTNTVPPKAKYFRRILGFF